MGPAGDLSESRLLALPAQDRLAPPLPLLPSLRGDDLHRAAHSLPLLPVAAEGPLLSGEG